MIKPAGSTGELLFDTETELSSKYFAASILDAAGIRHEDLSLSYFDIINGTPPPLRIVYGLEHWWSAWVDHGLSGTLKYKGVYEISGDANNGENWRFVAS